VKNWRNLLVLNIGLLLLLGSLIIFGLRISQTMIPAGSTPEQIAQLTKQFGLDRPLFEQYGFFLLLFLPALILLAIYGTVGFRRPDNPLGILPKLILALILVTNTLTALNYLLVAPSAQVFSTAFWFYLAIAGLGLTNFAFSLVVWNGLRWGMWSLGVSAFLMFILKFTGSVPIIPSIFELSTVVVLFFLIRTVWSEMD
jgi:hypothetical protein